MTFSIHPVRAPAASRASRLLAAHAQGRTGSVSLWLWGVAALVVAMVFLGGATRMTESGLSITQWQPVTGVVPPLTRAAWLDAFARYKEIPQYAALFPDMTLGHFQFIYSMEWLHRLVGRFVGVALVVPFALFWFHGALTRRLTLQLGGIFTLGGLQGVVGWWMVSSGLIGRVEVAQERLAVHLLLASITLAALVWVAAEQKSGAAGEESASHGLRHLATAVVALVLAQIGFGALVAGLRAGTVYNSWPLMDGRFVPPAEVLGAFDPLWRNLVDNLATVQFQHRMTAYLLLAVAAVQAWATSRAVPGTGAARRAVALAGLVAAQAAIGIVTLVLAVPLWAGLLHQLFAMVVLAMAVVHRQRLGASARVAALEGQLASA